MVLPSYTGGRRDGQLPDDHLRCAVTRATYLPKLPQLGPVLDRPHFSVTGREPGLDLYLRGDSRFRAYGEPKTMAKVEATLGSGTSPKYETPQLTRIPCASGHKIKLIDPQQVEHIHSDLSGVHVFTAEGNYFTELTLKVLEQQLGLLRCHKQYLVNLEQVAEITTLENGLAEIKTRSGQQLPVSRRYLRNLKEAFHL